MEGEFLVRTDAEIFCQRITVCVCKNLSFVAKLNIKLKIFKVKNLSERAVNNKLAVTVVHNMHTDSLVCKLRNIDIVAVEINLFFALGIFKRHILENTIVLYHIEHLGGFLAVAERNILVFVKNKTVICKLKTFSCCFKENRKLFIVHITLVAVVHICKELCCNIENNIELNKQRNISVPVLAVIDERL